MKDQTRPLLKDAQATLLRMIGQLEPGQVIDLGWLVITGTETGFEMRDEDGKVQVWARKETRDENHPG